MKMAKRTIVLTAIAAVVFGLVTAMTEVTASAQSPSYLVLRPVPKKRPDHTFRDGNRGVAYGVSRQPYAYGWFGASSYRKPALSYGYYGRYAQWSLR